LKIIVDSREPAEAVAMLPDCEVQKLEVGDYVTENCIAERKSVHDLENSVINDRLFAQVSEMSHTEKICFLIIHDSIYSLKRLTYEQALSAVASCCVRYGVHALWLPDFKSAMKTILYIFNKINEGKYMLPRLSIERIKSRKVGILSTLFRISPSKAKSLLDTFGSVKRVLEASEEELVIAPNIGPVTAKRIRLILDVVQKE